MFSIQVKIDTEEIASVAYCDCWCPSKYCPANTWGCPFKEEQEGGPGHCQVVCIYSRVHGIGAHTWSLHSVPHTPQEFILCIKICRAELDVLSPSQSFFSHCQCWYWQQQWAEWASSVPSSSLEPQEDLAAKSTAAPAVVRQVRALEVVTDKKSKVPGSLKENWKVQSDSYFCSTPAFYFPD